MKIVFFKNDVDFAKDFLIKNPDAAAFWYAPGLQSYRYINEILEITSMVIQEDLLISFKVDYPELIATIPFEAFKTKNKERLDLSRQNICFLASNDTIARSYKNILDLFDQKEYSLFCKPKENAKSAADKLNIPSKNIHINIPDIDKYSLLVLANDWGLTERKITQDFFKKGKNVICIQESSIDFNPVDNRMRYCSFPVFQGVATLQNINVNSLICAVIGNPRFEGLKPVPLPDTNKAFINVNFTYGIFEEVRKEWVDDIVTSCKELDIDYIISQHPRDRGEFENYNLLKSNPLMVHDTIKECSVLISRFSALLTEAICLGRPAIYYNPHGENMYYKFESDNKMFFCANNKKELKEALIAVSKLKYIGTNFDTEFVIKHLGVTNINKASCYIKMLLQDVAGFLAIKQVTVFERIKILLAISKRRLLKQGY